MADQRNTTFQFSVLFTAQKLKKHKTWQDGTITYHTLNRKIVLTDQKGYNIDRYGKKKGTPVGTNQLACRKFSRTGAPAVGEEIEFDLHIVTVESALMDGAMFQQQQQNPHSSSPTANTPTRPPSSAPQPPRITEGNQPYSLPERTSSVDKDYRLARRRLQRNIIGSNLPNLTQPRIKPGSVAAQYRMSNQQADSQLSANDHQPTGHQSIESEAPMISAYEPTQPRNDMRQPLAQVPTMPSISDKTPFAVSIGTPVTRPSYSKTFTAGAPVPNTTTLPAPPPHNRKSPSQSINLQQEHIENSALQSVPQPSKPSLEVSETHLQPAATIAPPHLTPSATLRSVPQSSRPSIPCTSANVPPQLTPGLDHTKRKPSNETNVGPPKRVRVGLSKKTGQSVSTSLANDASHVNESPRVIPPPPSNNQGSAATASSSPSSSRVTFMPASRVVVDEQDALMAQPSSSTSSSSLASTQPPKRFKVPYADGISVPLVLQFPTMERTMAVLKSKQMPKRAKVAPIQFTNASQYKDAFRRMIHEHLQIMLMNNALHFYSHLSSAKTDNLELYFRPKGLSFYQNCRLRSNHRSITGSTFSLTVRHRESPSKYGKDDVWVVSKMLAYDATTTFLARSTFYGPSSGGAIEIECITPRDTRVAAAMATEQASIFALRTISAGTEFMMLDTLDAPLERLPLIPHILKSSKRKKQPELHKPKLTAIRLTAYDNIDVKKKLDETTRFYNLNMDQEKVLRAVAKSVIVSPGWSEEAEEPITLVHGVFGSGKSFLAAVLIIFIREIIDSANCHREPEDQIDFRIMICCFTNVAVDRILTILVKLGFDEFVRIGSLKKISKNLLPYTIKAKLSGNEELKELEQMLDDPQNSDEETDNIANAIQRFRRCENMLELNKSDVVGTTCSASCFDIFSESTFPFILMDECSQVMEPMSMVPIVRFQSSKMVMIGDPKQLPPTIPTQADERSPGMGLDKPLFSRLVEMGTEPIMLRTQYRCHPRISSISSKLFYDRQLLDGANVETRRPLINGLPPLVFVDVLGNEQRSIGNSFWNQDEVAIAARTLKGLSELGVPALDIGVISLYKEQADKIQNHLANVDGNSAKNIQISTVDAFQGAEKEIIILSTVRTSSSGFIDKHPRVNVALTRARRHLIILGSDQLLRSNEVWSTIIKECQDNTMHMHEFTRYLSTLPPLNPATVP